MRKVDDILLNSFLQIHDVGDDGFNGIYVDPVERKNYFFVFSWGGGWEHLSVSQRNKTPSWDIMCRMKEIFWGDDEVCVEYHPKKEDYINLHPHCLHIWKEVGKEFATPPSIFVGFKTGNEHE
ncbi:MAG: hypothetical protein MJ216_03635 [Bacilli bacterium]|nr:hypothetical protein [Bacilli bacterium]